MSDYEEIKKHLQKYFFDKGVTLKIEETLKETSYNEMADRYLYSGSRNLSVISMDNIAKDGYRVIKSALGKPVNTVDAFLVDNNNDWYLIEFKDCKISSKKDNIEKKGMANFLMLLDIFNDEDSIKFEGSKNFFEFARKKLVYILVCSQDKDPYSYEQIRNCDNLGEKYRPDCLLKFKDYFFKDAYAYTEDYFENRFVRKFMYE